MFHSAALRLTLWYLGLIMAISLAFSFALYHVSSNDLGQNVDRQIIYFTGFLTPYDSLNYQQLRQNQLKQDKNHLRDSLILFNFIVLAGGGAASYALARRTLQPIEDSLEAQKRFTGDASHELRTPLTAMQTEIEVALRNSKLTKPEAVELLKSNLEEVNKLRSLSEGLLKLTSADGEQDFGEVVDLKRVVLQAIEQNQKTAESKAIKLEARLRETEVRGNYHNLVQLVSILLDNGIKYSPRGSKVLIDLQSKERHINIKISDKGIGIKPDDLPHIFERFFRADISRSKNESSGYGLGLALAKKIADTHDGAIEVESAPRKGSTFTLSLPLA